MTISVGGVGNVYPFPAPPRPLNDEGYTALTTNRIPHKGTLVDNIQVPTAFNVTGTGSWEGYLGESLVWSVDATDFNAACDGFLGIQACWYDSVNDRLYVVGVDTGPTPDTYYLGYITLETGAVTVTAGDQLSTDLAGITSNLNVNMHRSAIDSGNFTVRTAARTLVLNETTGAEVSNVAETNAVAGISVGTYASADGTVLLARNGLDATETSGTIEMTRNGEPVKVPAPMPLFSNVLSGLAENFLPWGDRVKVLKSTSVGTAVPPLRTFDRAAFDLWLNDVARIGGQA